MNIKDNSFAKFLDRLIEEKVRLILNQELKSSGFVKSWLATVESVNIDDTVNVQLPADDVTILTNKINKSGETLIVGDEVFLFSPYGRLDNSYVVWKK
jgi:hypothetical protein